MNLYRNSENMLETWVANTCPKIDNENVVVLESEQLALSGRVEGRKTSMAQELTGAIPRSESEDSGVELTCSEAENAPSTPWDSGHNFSLARKMEFCSLRQKDGCHSSTPPSFHNLSSCLSSSSPPNATALGKLEPSSVRFRVEQALWRANQTSKRVLRKTTSSQLPMAPSLFRADSGHGTATQLPCHSMTSRPGQRSGSLGSREAARPPTSIQHVPELKHCNLLKDVQPKTVHPCLNGNESDSQAQCEDGGVGDAFLGERVSPGLGYLEQVCRMLEEIARLQTSNQELQKENERVQNHQNAQGCQELLGQCLSSCPDNPLTVNQRPEAMGYNDLSAQSSHNDQLLPPYLWKRSMSDTQAHIRSKARQSQWIPSTGHILEECDSSMHYGQKQQDRVSNLTVKLKTVSLNRDAALQKPARQQTFPSGKNGLMKPFRLLFKKGAKNVSAC
ncbi:hypothetical protein AAFF_G00177290 [Aldrovandia affinis]|uniref:DUF4657 domain-containing protein n=1 Tax=Aldrovandia affinis TaxID=143900 RepID=A0AAD7W7A6_9TELE|nr:hypothetical protein AAFF_G00177290 [Aldrovandia affinis]